MQILKFACFLFLFADRIRNEDTFVFLKAVRNDEDTEVCVFFQVGS